MNKKDKYITLQLLKVIVKLNRLGDNVGQLFGDAENINEINGDVGGLLLDIIDVPKDDVLNNPGTGFCRDYFWEILYDVRDEKRCEEYLQRLVDTLNLELSHSYE